MDSSQPFLKTSVTRNFSNIILSLLIFASAVVVYQYKSFYRHHYHEADARIKLGEEAPDFTLDDLEEKPVTLSSFSSSKVCVLSFFATWCGPCRIELPHLEELYQQYKEKGLVILAINIEEKRETVLRFVERTGLSFPVLLDEEGRVAELYGVRAIPKTFVLDSGRKVRFIHMGRGRDELAFNQTVEELLSAGEEAADKENGDSG